ncbi:NADP-dependent oxidoreductase [Sphingomonas bacterium]|uniref:NADP-dependent oxidoreductase n=1 Tax=Sphingomonas bacterium TaxID=1895847 RepID=UPI001C2DA3A7|nr:NADP-dependent oxidoreductase [Sphingomonas bacterium]
MPDLPPRMRAARLSRFGEGGLAVEPADIPQAVDDEVLVRVRAASINPVDIKTAQGQFPPGTADDLPLTLGRDVAGTIEAVGTRAHNMLSHGDRVFAHIGFDRGAQAEFVVIKAVELVALPAGVSFATGAGAGLAAMTAWQALFDQGGLQPGETVLIHGGAGGVGHLAVQFAHAKGARVIATAGPDDLDFVRGLGADEAIDHKRERFEDRVRGVDLVLDLIGGETGRRSLAVIRDGGRLVSTLEPPETAERGIGVAPHWMATPNAAQLGEIADLLAAGTVAVTVSETFPLDEVVAAYARQDGGGVRGKIVLTV